MRKRLRKKKRLGEFQEWAFHVLAELVEGLSDPDLEVFVDRWIDAVEARNLGFCGGCGQADLLEGVLGRPGRGSPTPEDRVSLAAFLDGDPFVLRYQLGPDFDRWNGESSYLERLTTETPAGANT